MLDHPVSPEANAEDGSWALYFGGPADLSTTIEAYGALKVPKVIHRQGDSEGQGLYENLAGALRPVPLVWRPWHAAGVDLPVGQGAVQPLRLRLLGTCYHRPTADNILYPNNQGCCKVGNNRWPATHKGWHYSSL